MGVEIRGLDRLRNKLNLIPQLVEEATADAMNEAVDLTQEYAVQNIQSNFKYPSGGLAGSVETEVAKNVDNEIVGRVFSKKEHSFYTEFGTGLVGQNSPKDLPPGVVPVYSQQPWFFPVASVDKDLHALYGMLIIKIQEVEFYLTRGQPARPWLYPALKQTSEELPEIFKENVSKKLKEGFK